MATMQQEKLYELIVNEYHFQVKLNWNRNKFFIIINLAIVFLAFFLLGVVEFQIVQYFISYLFFLGILTSFIGLQTLLKGIEYRRRIILQKAKFESMLRIDGLNTTVRMQEAFRNGETEEWIKRIPRFGTINFYLSSLFFVLILLNSFALIYIFGNIAKP